MHFMNPVPVMKLVEIIKSDKTNQDMVDFMSDFLETVLGKGVAHAMDTPNTSPNTTQKALIPAIAPKPVNPNNNQADSPVALVERQLPNSLVFYLQHNNLLCL